VVSNQRPEVFHRGPIGSRDVVWNWRNDSLSELRLQAESYLKAADQLSESFKGGNGLSDFDAYPIIFLYRHALELFIKDILIVGNELSAVLQRPELATSFSEIVRDHGLRRHVGKLDEIFRAAGWANPITESKRREFIQSIEEVDPSSMAFRYSVDKNGKPSLPGHLSFSMANLGSSFRSLLEDLARATFGLRVVISDLYESKANEDGE
jgi:hypothetical protein